MDTANLSTEAVATVVAGPPVVGVAGAKPSAPVAASTDDQAIAAAAISVQTSLAAVQSAVLAMQAAETAVADAVAGMSSGES